jgi:hypothetical protein
MLLGGFKPEIPANEQLKTDALDHAATGIDNLTITDEKKGYDNMTLQPINFASLITKL